MQDFIPGQRWISNVDSQIGLGTVLASEHRTVTMLFLATGEIRTYSKQTASFTRIIFTVGDTVQSQDGLMLEVEKVIEQDGLVTYFGTDKDSNTVELPEGQLNHFMQLNRPAERLTNGQIDQDHWFALRYQTQLHLNRLVQSDLSGLTGCRTSLIAHQLYIALEVANRYAPRVLLADEVGLGKTIEAGLILHHQLLTERVKRVLIIVPESLVHQWLVEMLRRFNLHFSIFDEARCQALEDNLDQGNPFYSEQLVLCSLNFIVEHPDRFQQIIAGDWDLLVVDEAHHLEWSPQNASLEYEIIEQLTAKTKGLLLLTATPEQMGKTGHFARLRLLDPDRFSDFEVFMQEEKTYEPIAQAIEALLTDQPLNKQVYQTLFNTIQEGDNQPLLDSLINTDVNLKKKTAARQQLIEHLLDRHGTGRVLFRNTRAAIKGFPNRKLSAYPLPLPDAYIESQAQADVSPTQFLLSPELLYQSATPSDQTHWTRVDPRVNWLSKQLKRLKPEKVLVITSSGRSVLDVAEILKKRAGIHAAVFHEGLSILERDRAAAFFGDRENGSQVLICSEIGSEGRNFQFAHHIILFDLPVNPDLLEQRIGRLDRIGQTETINIHVCYLENSAQAVMYYWYQEGLNAFEDTCPAGYTVYQKFEAELIAALNQPENSIENLIRSTQTCIQQLNEALHRGRDRLLEYNSCRPDIAQALKEQAVAQDKTSTFPQYMEAVFDCFGVDTAIHSENCYIISPGSYMLRRFPGLPDDGMTATFNRSTALTNEDIQYLTWEHPMVTAAMDLIRTMEHGNTALTAVKYSGVKSGTLLLECIYILEPASTVELQATRYLPTTVVRVVTDESGTNHASELTCDAIKENQTFVELEIAKKIVLAKEKKIRKLIAASEQLAHQNASKVRMTAHQQASQLLTDEINRLKALNRVNPNVRLEEIEFFDQQLQTLSQLFDSVALRLDAVRVIVAVAGAG